MKTTHGATVTSWPARPLDNKGSSNKVTRRTTTETNFLQGDMWCLVYDAYYLVRIDWRIQSLVCKTLDKHTSVPKLCYVICVMGLAATQQDTAVIIPSANMCFCAIPNRNTRLSWLLFVGQKDEGRVLELWDVITGFGWFYLRFLLDLTQVGAYSGLPQGKDLAYGWTRQSHVAMQSVAGLILLVTVTPTRCCDLIWWDSF